MERNKIVEQMEEERVQDQSEEATDSAMFEGEDDGTPRSSSDSSEGQNVMNLLMCAHDYHTVIVIAFAFVLIIHTDDSDIEGDPY